MDTADIADTELLPVRGDLVSDVRDDRQQRGDLVVAAAQVVGGEQPDRDGADTGLRAPLQQIGDVLGTDPVTVADVLEAGLAGPPPVAVDEQSDVVRNLCSDEFSGELALVQAVKDTRQPHALTLPTRL